MNRMVLRGEISFADIVREAAARTIALETTAQPDDMMMENPSMSGLILTEEVQPGLILSGHDLTYTQDGQVEAVIEPMISCGVAMGDSVEEMLIEGETPVIAEPGKLSIFGSGQPLRCSRTFRRGQRGRAFGVALKPEFFSRFDAVMDGDGMEVLTGYVRPGVHRTTLPASPAMTKVAENTLYASYGGALQALHREAQALHFTLTAATMLQAEHQIVRRIGRRCYQRAQEAREILDASLVNPPKLLDLARLLGANVSTLQANFKAAFGTTIFGYVRDRRLEMAHSLIFDHGLGIAEAGYKVGFTNAAAFTAAYRRHFGHAPSAARQDAAPLGQA